MPNSWSNKYYVQAFYCESITLKAFNMFECMEIAESIHEGVVEPSYKQYTKSDDTCAGPIRKNIG